MIKTNQPPAASTKRKASGGGSGDGGSGGGGRDGSNQNVPGDPGGGGDSKPAPEKDRFELTLPVSIEPAFRHAASVARNQLIDRPAELKDFGAAIEFVASSPAWRALLSTLARNDRAQQLCAFVCRRLVELVQAAEDEAVKRMRSFVHFLTKDPKGTTDWYDKARTRAIPNLGDEILDATSFEARLIRWLVRRNFTVDWDKARQERAGMRARIASSKQTRAEGPAR